MRHPKQLVPKQSCSNIQLSGTDGFLKFEKKKKILEMEWRLHVRHRYWEWGGVPREGTDIGNGAEPLGLAPILGMGRSPQGWHSYWEWGGALRDDTDIGNGAEPLGLAHIFGMGRSP